MVKQKHFRLPEDVLAMINNRDKEMYPTENVYITEAVRNFFKKEETENVMDELKIYRINWIELKKSLRKMQAKKIFPFQAMQRKKNFMENQIS